MTTISFQLQIQWLTQAAIYHLTLFSKAGCVDIIEHAHYVVLSFHGVSVPRGAIAALVYIETAKVLTTAFPWHVSFWLTFEDENRCSLLRSTSECLVKAFKYVGIRVTGNELIKYEYEYALKVAVILICQGDSV